MGEELKLQQKWEDMAVYAYQAVKMYPKSERHTLAADTTRSVLALGTGIARANVTRSTEARRRIIADADTELARLKTLVRLGVRLEFLPLKKYEILSVRLVEIGKMLGGWSKSALCLYKGMLLCKRIPIRGGNWNNAANAGVSALNLNNRRSNANTNIGFRPALVRTVRYRAPTRRPGSTPDQRRSTPFRSIRKNIFRPDAASSRMRDRRRPGAFYQ